jgi:hypothetical protein
VIKIKFREKDWLIGKNFRYLSSKTIYTIANKNPNNGKYIVTWDKNKSPGRDGTYTEAQILEYIFKYKYWRIIEDDKSEN